MNKTGFTLIETLVAIFVFTLVAGAVFSFVAMAYRMYSYSWQQSRAVDEARRGIEKMAKEIRTASFGEDGSYPIEKAENKEFIFYSDIDGDGNVERVRYFLGTVNSDSQIKECQTSVQAGSCGVNFDNFLQGALTSAEIKASVDGDFGWNKEYADIYADGNEIGTICDKEKNCSDCLGSWQGAQTFDVTSVAADNHVSFLADAAAEVDPDECASYAMKARFELSWTEDLGEMAHELRKGVIKPVTDTGGKISYPSDEEKISILTSYVRNAPPIFKYFNQEGEELTETPARLKDTKVMEIYLIVNINPNRAPQDFELRSAVQLRNLKDE